MRQRRTTLMFTKGENTPHELMFGRMARIFTSSTLTDDKSNESYFEYATALFNQIFDAQASAKILQKFRICKT